MQVFATIATFLLFGTLISGANLPSGCYSGNIDAKTCCTGISDWYVHLPDPENCGKFYQCDNGKAVHKECPASLHWSIAADRCEWPENAGCQSKDQCEPAPANPQCISGEISPNICCENVKTYYKLELPNSNNCSSYYKCISGQAILQQCPEGLHWSVNSDRCEHPEDAQCKIQSTTPYPDYDVSEDCLYGKVSVEECCKGVPYWVDVLLQNNNDCHTYIQCVHQKPMVRPCPAGLWWSVTRNRCEWKNYATCTW